MKVSVCPWCGRLWRGGARFRLCAPCLYEAEQLRCPVEEFRHAMMLLEWREEYARGWYWVGWAAVAEKARQESLTTRIRRGLFL